MPTIDEMNAVNAPSVRTEAGTIAGVTVAVDAAKAAREATRAARAEVARLAKVAKEAATAAKVARENAPKAETARDYVRAFDAAILAAADEIAAGIISGDGEVEVPEDLRNEVIALVANQLHHLANPKNGWNCETLPVPDRSEWR